MNDSRTCPYAALNLAHRKTTVQNCESEENVSFSLQNSVVVIGYSRRLFLTITWRTYVFYLLPFYGNYVMCE